MEDARGVRPCPRETRSLFATSFHCFTLVSFRHTSETAKYTECRQDTSGKNDSSESKPLFLAKGHQVQHPSVLSLSTPRQLGFKFSHFMLPSKFGRLCSFFLQISSFPTREHITEQGLLLRTDTAQLLFRSFPMPALHYNPKPSIPPTKFRHLEKCRKFRFFETAPKRSPWHSKHASACQSYENEQISTKMTDDCRNFPTKTRSSKTTP